MPHLHRKDLIVFALSRPLEKVSQSTYFVPVISHACSSDESCKLAGCRCISHVGYVAGMSSPLTDLRE